MPKLSTALPRYSKHKASGQAFVKIEGQFFYLGLHGSEISKQQYDRIIAEWLSNNRRLKSPTDEDGKSGISCSITRLCIDFYKHAKVYYRKNGKQTGEAVNIKNALKYLRELYGDLPAEEFSPLKLQAVQQHMIKNGICRKSINRHTDRIKRCFLWGGQKEMIPAATYTALRLVKGLKSGRTDAKESKPVKPIAPSIIFETLTHMGKIPSDMVRIQMLTGCRPGEVCMMRPCDIDRSSEVWLYTPKEHKTEHAGKVRVVFIGPEAQAILTPYLSRPSEKFCFSPAEETRRRAADARSKRKRPLKYEYRKRKPQPKRRPGEKYTTASYRKAIHRGCDAAFKPPKELEGEQALQWAKEHRWAPNRVRHTTATAVRKRFGLEAAQVILGHSHADVTQMYAEVNMEKGIEVIRQIG